VALDAAVDVDFSRRDEVLSEAVLEKCGIEGLRLELSRMFLGCLGYADRLSARVCK
jgi:hypothetical protein